MAERSFDIRRLPGAATLAITCVVWAATPPSTSTPSFMPSWPDKMMKSPARTNGE